MCAALAAAWDAPEEWQVVLSSGACHVFQARVTRVGGLMEGDEGERQRETERQRQRVRESERERETERERAGDRERERERSRESESD